MEIFTTYIYQPFFNILVGIYWLVGNFLSQPDMGIAVILFSVAVRLILLPMDLAAEKSDHEKMEISLKMKNLERDFSSDPIKLRQEAKKLMRQSPGAIISEVINIIIQAIIIVVLYRIFTTGLEGEDLYLLYSFMPKVQTPINLMFLGQFDLSKTNTSLNILQSVMIALNEIVHLYFSPIKPTRKDFISLVILFPVVCFLVFLFLPAGKKIFIITSLAFGIALKFIKQGIYLYHYYLEKPAVVQDLAVTNNPSSEQSSDGIKLSDNQPFTSEVPKQV